MRHTHDHDVLEDNTTVYTFQAGYSINQIKNADEDFAAKSAYALIKQPIKSGTAVQWHQLLAHAGDEVIQHLKSAAEEMKIIENTIFKIHECEVCVLSKMHKIVSRSSEKKKNSNASFFRISYDFIPMIMTLNGHK